MSKTGTKVTPKPFTINRPQIVLAFSIEALIVGASIATGILFARRYGRSDSEQLTMLIGPAVLAALELSRVPLAMSVRLQPSKAMRVLAIIAIVCASAVTTKTLAQTLQLQFRPRLEAVITAKRGLDVELERKASLAGRVPELDAAVARANGARQETAAHVEMLGKEIAKRTSNCGSTRQVDAVGKVHVGRHCAQDPTAQRLLSGVATMQADQHAQQSLLAQAGTQRATLTAAIAAQDGKVEASRLVWREALSNSQIYDFVGMVFRQDPAAVSEDEVSTLLLFFTILPAAFVATISSVLAMTAIVVPPKPVAKIKPAVQPQPSPSPQPVPRSVTLNDEAAEFFLHPYARTIIEKASREAAAAAHAAIDAAVQEARKPNGDAR
jgi:hypothetical protein